MTVAIPTEAYDGQVIRLEGQGEPSTDGGPAGALILTVAIQKEEKTDLAASTEQPVAPPPPPPYTPTVAASDADLQQPIAPPPPPPYALPPTVVAPLYLQQPITPHPPYPEQPTVLPARPPVSPGTAASRPSRFRGRTILLIGLALLIVLASIGLFAIIRSNQIAANHANATATAQANNATATANTNATATAFAQDLNATETAQINANATADANATATVVSANPNRYAPGGGRLALHDPLSDNAFGNNWSEGTDNSGGSCEFQGGAYHVSESNIQYANSCFASPDFSNFAVEVQMKIITGDAGGIILRADSTNNKLYVFVVGQDGSYFFDLYTSSTHIKILTSNTSSAINQGLNQTNLLAVVAQGNAFTLYVNHQQIASVSDNTYNQGQIGFTANPYANNGHPTEIAFSNVNVWTL